MWSVLRIISFLPILSGISEAALSLPLLLTTPFALSSEELACQVSQFGSEDCNAPKRPLGMHLQPCIPSSFSGTNLRSMFVRLDSQKGPSFYSPGQQYAVTSNDISHCLPFSRRPEHKHRNMLRGISQSQSKWVRGYLLTHADFCDLAHRLLRKFTNQGFEIHCTCKATVQGRCAALSCLISAQMLPFGGVRRCCCCLTLGISRERNMYTFLRLAIVLSAWHFAITCRSKYKMTQQQTNFNSARCLAATQSPVASERLDNTKIARQFGLKRA